jgi:hypothetical protein
MIPSARIGDSSGEPTAGDTSPEAMRVQLDLWRSMSPAEKATVVSGVSIAVRQLALAGIQARHPGASNRECMLRLALMTLGRELACKVYPDAVGFVDS